MERSFLICFKTNYFESICKICVTAKTLIQKALLNAVKSFVSVKNKLFVLSQRAVIMNMEEC